MLQTRNTGAENQQVQHLEQQVESLPFLEQAHFSIRLARQVVAIARSKLTASFVRPIEYSEQYDLLEATIKNFEQFRELIDQTPDLPPEITLSHEMFRVKVNMALGHIKAAKSCIESIGSPCTDIAQKLSSSLAAIDELVRDCKLEL